MNQCLRHMNIRGGTRTSQWSAWQRCGARLLRVGWPGQPCSPLPVRRDGGTGHVIPVQEPDALIGLGPRRMEGDGHGSFGGFIGSTEVLHMLWSRDGAGPHSAASHAPPKTHHGAVSLVFTDLSSGVENRLRCPRDIAHVRFPCRVARGRLESGTRLPDTGHACSLPFLTAAVQRLPSDAQTLRAIAAAYFRASFGIRHGPPRGRAGRHRRVAQSRDSVKPLGAACFPNETTTTGSRMIAAIHP